MADLDQLSLLRALTEDKENASRIATLHEAMSQHEAKLVELRQVQGQVEQSRQEAVDLHQRTRAIEAANVQRSAELDERERVMGTVNNAINEEKAKFSVQRTQIEADLKRRQEALDAADAESADRLAVLDEREKAVTAREQAIEGLQENLEAKHAALRQIVGG